MINWIKFTERQPEKEGEYLCFYQGRYTRMLNGIYFDQKFFDPWEKSRQQMENPDYWAEINPPGVCENCDPSAKVVKNGGISFIEE